MREVVYPDAPRKSSQLADQLAEAQGLADADPTMGGSPGQGANVRRRMFSMQGSGRRGAASDALRKNMGATGDFAHDLLVKLGKPVTQENKRAINAWVKAEGTRAGYNPLATTQSWEGATRFNSVGVRNYLSYEDGLDATVTTLNNGRYGVILDALSAGNDAMAVGRAVSQTPWGTGDGVLRVLGGR